MSEDVGDWAPLLNRDDLTRELSLEQYVKEQVEESESMDATSRQLLDEFVQSITLVAQAGDSWWEWVRGPENQVPKMQMGGLALVRNGSIVWATMTWIS